MVSTMLSVFAVIDAASVSYNCARGDRQQYQVPGSTMAATHVALLYERENVIQCSMHGRLPRPFENLFSLLHRVPTDARSVLSFRGPGVCRGPYLSPPLLICMLH